MLFMSLDQGGSSSRAMIIDDQGRVKARAQQQVDTFIDNAYVEQSAIEVISSLQQCIKDCYQQLSPDERQQVKCAGLVTQRASFIAINSQNHQPLSRIISWQDTRAAALLAQLNVDSMKLANLTGLQKSAHYGVSKMLWLLKHEDKVIKASQEDTLLFLPLASYLASALTLSTTYCVDPANAARTLLFALPEPNPQTEPKPEQYIAQAAPQLRWAHSLIKDFSERSGVTLLERFLPEVCHSNSVYGQLPFGEQRIPLSYLSGDQSAALFAYGAPKPHAIYINLGTGAFINCVLDDVAVSTQQIISKGLLKSIVHAGAPIGLADQSFDYRYVIEGTVNGAGAAISLMAQQLCVDTAALDIAYIQQHGCVPLFINTIGGLAAPHWRADVPWQFIGSEYSSNEEKMVAVIESISFLISDIIGLMVELNNSSNEFDSDKVNCKKMNSPKAKVKKVKLDGPLIITGGLANLTCLLQNLADLNNKTVETPTEVEATSLGCAWWLAKQPENWLNDTSKKSFLPKTNPLLSKRYEAWKNALTKVLG